MRCLQYPKNVICIYLLTAIYAYAAAIFLE